MESRVIPLSYAPKLAERSRKLMLANER